MIDLSAVVPTLAWTPFLEPWYALHNVAYLMLIPLSFGISVIYKALRLPDLDRFWLEVLVMTTQVIISMIALGVGLTVLVQWLVPMLPVTTPL